MKTRAGFLLLLSVFVLSLSAAEFSEGDLRLVLHENTGRFSLYSLDEAVPGMGRPLFVDEDPRTSFLSVMVDDRSHKMGDTSTFRIRLNSDSRNPSFIFESAFMIVTEEFSFIRINNSPAVNGIRISITLENKGERQVSASARFLLDTNLGDRTTGFSFSTDRRTIASETILSGMDEDRFWTDSNGRLSLTGSIFTGSSSDPDSVHFANWKKMNDVTWKAAYQPGRNFNFPPYSIGDSAVCYYFEPRLLGRGDRCSFGFTLSLTESYPVNIAGSSYLPDAAGNAGSASSITILDMQKSEETDSGAEDMAALRRLIARIEAHMATGTASEEEIIEIEFALNKLRAKYSPGYNTR